MGNIENRALRQAVRSELDLSLRFAELADLKKLPYGIQLHHTRPIDTATISIDKIQLTFDVIFLLNASVPKIREIEVQGKKSSNLTLFVVPNLKSQFLDVCRRLRISAIDLNGRSLIRREGIYIETPRLPRRNFRAADDPGDIFKGKSGRIVRTLLSNRLKEWQQSEIAGHAGATDGLVSRVVRYLLDYGVLQRINGRRIRVSDHQRLLDMWLKNAAVQRNYETYRFAAFSSDPVQLARDIASVLGHANIDFAFTQWIAGWLRHPYTEPQVVSIYVHTLPPKEIIEKLSLRSVTDGGKVWFLIPSDPGVLMEKQTVGGLPLVTDAQIVVDLDDTGLRGPDQATALREWESFCIPSLNDAP